MRIQIHVHRIELYLLLLPILKPGILNEDVYSEINKVYTVLRIAVFFVLVLKCVISHKLKWNTLTIKIALFEAWVLLSTIITEPRGIYVWAGPALSIITMALLFDFYKEDMYDLIGVIGNILFLYFLINEATVIWAVTSSGSTLVGLQWFEPNLPLSRYFLGLDNRFINYFFPGVICNIVSARRNGYKYGFKASAILIGGGITLIWLWAVGGMIGMFLLAFLIFAGDRLIRGRIFNANVMLTMIIVLNIVIISSCLINPDLIRDVMDLIFQKGNEFMDRVTMWRGVVANVFASHPIMGIGAQSQGYMAFFMRFNHAHNLMMTTLYQGGLVGLVLLWWSIYTGCRPLMEYKEERLAVLILGAIVGELFTNLADSTFDSFFIILLCMASNYTLIRQEASS